MDISDIATREFVEVDANKRLGKVRAIFERENPKGIIVTEDDAYTGIITQKQLVQSHVEDDAKAGAMIRSAPKVERTADVRKVARVLVEGGTKVAPVFQGEELWGIITEDAILEAVIENLDALTIEQIYTEDVITVEEDTNVGQVVNLLRKHSISRLPVLDDTDGLTAGAILLSALERAGYTVEASALEKPYPLVLQKIFEGRNRIVIFADFAGKIAPMISRLNRGGNLVLIVDHHPAEDVDDPAVHVVDADLKKG